MDFTLAQRPADSIQPLQDLGGAGDALRCRPVQREIGTVDVAEYKVVVRRYGRLRGRDRIPGECSEHLNCLAELGHCVAAGCLHGHAPAVRERSGHI